MLQKLTDYLQKVHIIGASDKIKIKGLFLAAEISCPHKPEIFTTMAGFCTS
jgi:hypothetical protein